jgi:hypothetical protein
VKKFLLLTAFVFAAACNMEGASLPQTAPLAGTSTSSQTGMTAAQKAILRRPQRCGAIDGMSGRRLPACPTEQEFEAAFGKCYHIVGYARNRAEAEAIVRETHDQQVGSGAYRMVDGRYGVSYRMSGPRLVMDRHLFSNAVYGPRTIHWHIDRRKNARPSSNGPITRPDEACVPVDRVAAKTDWNFDNITQARAQQNRAAREQARREAASRPRAPISYNATPTSPEPASTSSGVSVDRDGWVKVDGRSLGRVWSSYGWNISCNNGYNSGYGSNSPWGGSFKVDVRNRDEATGILLRACRR